MTKESYKGSVISPNLWIFLADEYRHSRLAYKASLWHRVLSIEHPQRGLLRNFLSKVAKEDLLKAEDFT